VVDAVIRKMLKLGIVVLFLWCSLIQFILKFLFCPLSAFRSFRYKCIELEQNYLKDTQLRCDPELMNLCT